MSRQTENRLEAYFREQVRSLGGIPVKLAPTTRGVPDRLVLLPNGEVRLVELKTRSGTVDPMQRLWHERAGKIGHHVDVVRGREGIDRWIEGLYFCADA